MPITKATSPSPKPTTSSVAAKDSGASNAVGRVNKKQDVTASVNDASKIVGFGDILRGVVYVLSGFQNPSRDNIRRDATSMGAKYEANWSDSCTHLISAFENTPKTKEAKGKGVIVKKEWIEACKSKRRRLPVHAYTYGAPIVVTDSDEEDDVVAVSASHNKPVRPTSSSSKDRTDDEEDTGDEIRRKSRAPIVSGVQKTILSGNTRRTTPPVQIDDDDDTEPEMPAQSMVDIKKSASLAAAEALPDFLDGVSVLFYQLDEQTTDKRNLVRRLVAYGAEVEEYMATTTTHVVSSASWDATFQSAHDDNPALLFVRPEWVLQCHQEQRRVPTAPYEIRKK